LFFSTTVIAQCGSQPVCGSTSFPSCSSGALCGCQVDQGSCQGSDLARLISNTGQVFIGQFTQGFICAVDDGCGSDDTSGTASVCVDNNGVQCTSDGASTGLVQSDNPPPLFPCCQGSGTISGDPHIHGPNGEKFDFDGAPNAAYTLMSSPNFVVNMALAQNGPVVRFITMLALSVGNETVIFDAARDSEATFINGLKKKLSPLGSKVTGNFYRTTVDVCEGQRCVISRWKTFSKQYNTTFYYFDVDFDIFGCHDDFDGVVGQMYQCKYATKESHFSWNPASEENFRVSALTSPSGKFDSQLPCYKRHEFGEPPQNIAKASAMKLKS